MEKEREKEKDSLKKKKFETNNLLAIPSLSRNICFSREDEPKAWKSIHRNTKYRILFNSVIGGNVGGRQHYFFSPSLPPSLFQDGCAPSIEKGEGKGKFPLGIDRLPIGVCRYKFNISLTPPTRTRSLASSRADNEAIFGIKVGKAIHACIFKHSRTRPLSKLIRIENIIWIWSLMLLGHSRLIYRDKLRRFPVLHTPGEQILDKSDKTKFSKRERERERETYPPRCCRVSRSK